MKRRDFFCGSSLVGTSAIAGCVDNFFSNNTMGEANRTHFKKIESGYIISVQNELAESVDAKVTVTNKAKTTKEESVSLAPGDTTHIKNPFPFTTNSESYTVSVSANREVIERTLQPNESPDNKFVYTITSDGIKFKKRRRPAADIAVLNNLNKRVDVRVTINGPNGALYDDFTVPSGDFVSFRDVFSQGDEYKVRVQSNGMTESITFRNSSTSGISINIDRNELRVKSFDH